MYRGVHFVCGLLAVAYSGGSHANAQGQSPPAPYVIAIRSLAQNDTATAIKYLRETVREAPDFGPAYLRLGAVLTLRAGELETEFETRLEAKRALTEAIRLMGDDPEALLYYGLLLRKQRLRVDAERILRRAWRAAEDKGADLEPPDRARLHYHLARIYETWWEDWSNLILAPEFFRGTFWCARTQTPAFGSLAGVYARFAVYCPEEFAEQLPHLTPLADLKSEERARMLEHFRLALRADPTDVDAGVRLLGHLADAGEWAEYEAIARRLMALAPNDPRPALFLGLGLHRRGRSAAADSAFRRGLALLAPEERAAFEDVAALLTPAARKRYEGASESERNELARALFVAKDPLYLTDVEERRLEHYARVAWAELKFGDPATGRRGWDSERGRIWIRYGRPWREVVCCYGAAAEWRGALGRVVIWSYGERGPNFAFGRKLTYRHARLTGPAKQLADELERRLPEMYRPTTITTVHAIPYQVARFRGDDPRLTRVEIYAAPPLDSLGLGVGDTLEAGVFVFDPAYRPVVKRRHTARLAGSSTGLTYILRLPAGDYRLGLEARRAGPDTLARPLARARAELPVVAFPPDSLAISDLLVADALRPLDPRPRRRSDLSIKASRTLQIEGGADLHLYFEVYGLRADPDGLARYRVEVSVTRADEPGGTNIVARALRGLAQLFSREQGGEATVGWDRATPTTNGAAIEFLTLALGAYEPARYRVRIGLKETASGRVARTERDLWLGPSRQER
jgi:GWxTD domain-containing protein